VIAGDSAAKALANGAGAAGALVGGLFAGHAAKLGALGSAHTLAAKALVDIVRAINSLHIAGTNVAVGVADNALSALLGNIRCARAYKYEQHCIEYPCVRSAGCVAVVMNLQHILAAASACTAASATTADT
jgi:hypothetical protein